MLLRKRVRNRSFSIVCNNCWGGAIYQDLGMIYSTPFVGLFLYPECFVKLTADFQRLIQHPIRFITESRYGMANEHRKKHYTYPIGLLGDDIEVHFIHTHQIDQAKASWERRLKRLQLKRLYFALIQRELCTVEHCESFLKQAKEPRVVFANFPNPQYESWVHLEECKKFPYVTDLVKYPYLYRKRFDVANWLNRGDLKISQFYSTWIRFMNPVQHRFENSREVYIIPSNTIL